MYTIYFSSTDKMIGFLGKHEFADSDECVKYLVYGNWGTEYPAEKYGNVYFTIDVNNEPLSKGAILLIISFIASALDISEQLDTEHKRRAMEGIAADF